MRFSESIKTGLLPLESCKWVLFVVDMWSEQSILRELVLATDAGILGGKWA